MNYRETNIEGLGVSEWFKIGEYRRAEKVIKELGEISIKHIRAGFSYEDWLMPEGKKWFEWLFSNLSSHFEILPCFVFSSSSDLYKQKDFSEFIKLIIKEFGNYFIYFELLNKFRSELNSRVNFDLDSFCDLVEETSNNNSRNNKKLVIGGVSAENMSLIDSLLLRNLLQHIDVIGIRDFPGNFGWTNWADSISKVRVILDNYQCPAKIWITETGFSTWALDEFGQITHFVDFLKVGVDRRFWYSAEDLTSELFSRNDYEENKRHYYFGLIKKDGNPKLLYRIWKEQGLKGIENISGYDGFTSRSYKPVDKNKFAMITGGAGFIGTNLADKLLSSGKPVIVYDNLSRVGTEHNVQWLREKYHDKVKFKIADIRCRHSLRDVLDCVDQVFHLAAQVAVTTSLADPLEDFGVNVNGTLNLLEEIRAMKERPSLLFTSTNKVYGNLDDMQFSQNSTRYEPTDHAIRTSGISEIRPLDFHSPYGCSKGSADQYVLDYSRIYDLQTVVFRMSCIYGPHQFGTEDQGWVAYFLLQAMKGDKIVIYGDGKQVRDILFIEDLTDAMMLTMNNMTAMKGRVFNIGGGAANSISILELLEHIKRLTGSYPEIDFGPWRSGDQKYYVSNINCFRSLTGWQPKIDTKHGIKKLYNWLEIYKSQTVQESIEKVAL